jgi:hypothetical protein
MVYNSIMKYDEKNIIVENVFTEKEVLDLYTIIENPLKKSLQKNLCQSVSDFNLPKEIRQKVIDYCERISGESDLEISEYQFARYKKVVDESSGETLFPNLFPHRDSFLEPRFTFDYQIGGNVSWSIIVEDKEYLLKNNSALTFSGTHQIHWRNQKEFSDTDYLDMIFFHLRKVNSLPYSKEVNEVMEAKSQKYFEVWQGKTNNVKD